MKETPSPGGGRSFLAHDPKDGMKLTVAICDESVTRLDSSIGVEFRLGEISRVTGLLTLP
jgi:hypothetical protein